MSALIVLISAHSAPILVTESASGSDAPNVYLRLRLAEGRGWSVHDLGLSCLLPWPEGDYLTQRRLDILVGAVGTIDPTVDDPSHLPALYKIDDPERYTKEIIGTDESGNPVASADPFPFEVETADFPLSNGMGTGLLRGFLLRYQRPTAPFTVEILVDGQVIQSEQVQPSWPEPNDVYIGVSPDDNVGANCRLRIFDETEYSLNILSLAPQWIDKGVRG